MRQTDKGKEGEWFVLASVANCSTFTYSTFRHEINKSRIKTQQKKEIMMKNYYLVSKIEKKVKKMNKKKNKNSKMDCLFLYWAGVKSERKISLVLNMKGCTMP